jgi:hydrogenase nickel incorporation protein HypA/HybF
MHELRIAEDLAAIVLEEAKKNLLSKVYVVNITFGQMIQIVPDIFRFAFSEIVSGTPAEEAEINIEIKPVKMRCRTCGNDFVVSYNKFECQSCGSIDLVTIQGKELFIKSIEGE